MRISGFTIVRNAVKYDYPVVESITSILPVCDEFIVAVGNSDDGTRELIQSIGSPKIRIIDTMWDDNLKKGGEVLAVETDKALSTVSPDSTWAFYIQADEVIHEKYLPVIRSAAEQYKDDPRVEGLLFHYLHFYGSYDFFGDSRRWYRNEVRLIRNDRSIRSYLDAQGFRKNGQPLAVVAADAWVYHYGWVKPPGILQSKLENFHRYWHDEEWIKRNLSGAAEFDYSQVDSLGRFAGTHPAVMQPRISQRNWHFDFDPTKKRLSLRKRLLHLIEKKSGWRIGEYRNYRIIRTPDSGSPSERTVNK